MSKFIIYSPWFDEDSGGIISLHQLAVILRERGEESYIWNVDRPRIRDLWRFSALYRFLKYLVKRFFLKRYVLSPKGIPVAKDRYVKDAVVVYPEIVAGNPLRAKRVVRWFLNYPGRITNKVEFGQGEIYFFYNDHFNDWDLNPNRDHRLQVVDFKASIYPVSDGGDRTGSCYMVRKGAGRPLNYHDSDAICIDGMTHEQISAIFRKCRYFISYDLYTMFSRYAAISGCIPVVVPQPGLAKEAWRPDVENRYGIAYGWDDVQWALDTREDLLKFLAESESRSRQSVERFIDKTKSFFELA